MRLLDICSPEVAEMYTRLTTQTSEERSHSEEENQAQKCKHEHQSSGSRHFKKLAYDISAAGAGFLYGRWRILYRNDLYMPGKSFKQLLNEHAVFHRTS